MCSCVKRYVWSVRETTPRSNERLKGRYEGSVYPNDIQTKTHLALQ